MAAKAAIHDKAKPRAAAVCFLSEACLDPGLRRDDGRNGISTPADALQRKIAIIGLGPKIHFASSRRPMDPRPKAEDDIVCDATETTRPIISIMAAKAAIHDKAKLARPLPARAEACLDLGLRRDDGC